MCDVFSRKLGQCKSVRSVQFALSLLHFRKVEEGLVSAPSALAVAFTRYYSSSVTPSSRKAASDDCALTGEATNVRSGFLHAASSPPGVGSGGSSASSNRTLSFSEHDGHSAISSPSCSSSKEISNKSPQGHV